VARLRDIEKGDLFGGKSKGESGERGPVEMAPAAFTEELESIEKDMNELRAQYELFFMGVERVEPTIQKDVLRARLRRLRDEKINNNALRFKLQALNARLISLNNYWGRVNREREAGTYFRDVQKAKKRTAEHEALELLKQKGKKKKGLDEQAQTAAAESPEGEGEALNETQLREEGQSAAETSPLMPRSAQPRTNTSMVGRPSAQSAADLTEPKLKQIYQAYTTAKKRCGEKVDLRFEDMAAALKKQVPELMKSTGAQAIEFKVVIKSGKAVLKAIPKKDE
jgi:hypothetical protein